VALDVARGLAVIGMIYMHLVPTEGAEAFLARAATGLARLIEGKPAALFCILAGMAWGIQAERAAASERFPRYVARRALALAAAGLAFHVLVWPTEILLPLALMMILSLVVRRAGMKATLTVAVLLVAAAPLAAALFGGYVPTDWNSDGTPLADSQPGWATVRSFLFDGSYPIVPWMAFPLVGMAMLDGDRPRADLARWFRIALAVAAVAQVWVLWSNAHAESFGAVTAYVTSTWVPTSVPFVLLAGGSAVTVIVGLVRWHAAAGLPRLAMPIALLGRASLTHYLLHIGAVIVPLRLAWPAEDWPVRVGAAAFAGYLALALPLTTLWFRRFSHGPLEGVWAAASGRAR
jgi:uncharacterized membrane protein YeiB